MKRINLLFLCVCLITLGCQDTIIENNSNQIEADEAQVPTHITAYLSSNSDTRTTYTDENSTLYTSWAVDDHICLTPNGRSYYSTTYKVSSIDGSKAEFDIVSGGKMYSADTYLYYYPGDKIKNDIQYMNFTYEGQVQKKNNPTGHLGLFHSMRKEESSVLSEIDFKGANQSACMKFSMSGMTFNNPSKVVMMCNRYGGYQSVFYKNNRLSTYYNDTNGSYDGLKRTSSLDISLEGYGKETQLDVYMMMSNESVELKANDVIRVFVSCSDGVYAADINVSSNTTLSGGCFHRITIDGGWEKDDTFDFTEYDFDGDVVTLQNGTKQGLDLVIMGDGFVAEDIMDGTYENIMKQAYSEFFELEPLKSHREWFNVYYVKAVSPQRIQAIPMSNGAKGDVGRTKFSTCFTEGSTSMDGNDDLIKEWAKKAFTTNSEERIKNATIVVMANLETRAGTCLNQWYLNNGKDYGEAVAVAYCALGHNPNERREIMRHEICGHGFGKLADEYYYTSNSSLSSSELNNLKSRHEMGLFRNVDCYIDDYLKEQLGGSWELTTKDNVYWHDMFNTSNCYESADVESLGIYKGAYTYPFAFCRPTEDANKSIMNNNNGIFNAISRRQIYYRIHCLAGENIGSFFNHDEYEKFLEWDANVFIPTLSAQTRAGNDFCVILANQPLDPPVWQEGTWLNGHFIPKD